MAKLTNTIIEAAIHGYEAQKKSIDTQIAELRAMLNGTPGGSAEEVPAPRKRRKFSAAVIERMRAAQRLRWAKIRGESKSAPEPNPATAAKPKRELSAAGRKVIAEAVRRRWAAKRAASGQTAPVVKKAVHKKAA